MAMHEERILGFYVWLYTTRKCCPDLTPTIISWGKNAIFIIFKLKTIGLFFPNILDVFPAMDLVISSVVLAKFSFSKFKKTPSFLKFYFFTDFWYPFWLFENPSWNIIVLLDLKDLFITLQTKFLYWAKLVDSVTRLQLPADLIIPVNQLSRNLSPL